MDKFWLKVGSGGVNVWQLRAEKFHLSAHHGELKIKQTSVKPAMLVLHT